MIRSHPLKKKNTYKNNSILYWLVDCPGLYLQIRKFSKQRFQMTLLIGSYVTYVAYVAQTTMQCIISYHFLSNKLERTYYATDPSFRPNPLFFFKKKKKKEIVPILRFRPNLCFFFKKK
jgi:hypothetical protein